MRVLVARAGALGDVLLLRRALFGLRRGGHRVTLLAPRGPGSALVGSGPAEAQSLLPWDAPDLSAWLAGAPGEDSERVAALASHDVALAFTRDPALVAALRRTLGRVVAHAPEPAQGHASDWLARPLADLGVPAAPDPPVQVATPEEDAAAAALLGRLPRGFLALHPGSGSRGKNWPADRFAALAERLAPDRPFLLVEGPADAEAVRPLRALGRAVVARELPPRLLGALLAGAGLYVGNDSGVSHLAAAWGAPSLVLFGPTDPRVWSPVGPSVRALRGDGGRLDALDAERVEAEARLLH